MIEQEISSINSSDAVRASFRSQQTQKNVVNLQMQQEMIVADQTALEIIKHTTKNARQLLFLLMIRQYWIRYKNKAAVLMLKKSKILELVTKSLSILGMKVKVKTYGFDFVKEIGKSKSSVKNPGN